MAKKMTLTKAKGILKLNGMTLRKTSAGDYRVNFKGDPEVNAVYEATINDAVDTARQMWMHRHRFRSYMSGE